MTLRPISRRRDRYARTATLSSEIEIHKEVDFTTLLRFLETPSDGALFDLTVHILNTGRLSQVNLSDASIRCDEKLHRHPRGEACG
jgi:hypothetical protein